MRGGRFALMMRRPALPRFGADAVPMEKPPPAGQPVQQSSVHTGVPELRAKVQPRRAVALHATTRP